MSLLTNEWRLKLGALALSLVLLGAVAFSQVKTDHVTTSIAYVNRPSNLVLLSPPDQINVAIAAPAELFPLNKTSVTVTADLGQIRKGTNQQINFKVHSSDPRISATTPPPINVDVDELKQVQLNVQIRESNVVAGWQVIPTRSAALCGNSSAPCSVTFIGPAALTDGLVAFVTVTAPIANVSTEVPNQQVKFEQKGQAVDVYKMVTTPQITVDPSTVTAHVEALTTTASRQVVLIDAPPTRLPAPGYRITKIVVEPPLVLISGQSDALAKAGDSITLDAVDLGGATSDRSFKVNITYPQDTTGTVRTASITYSISANPSVGASPSPGA